jgi:subtilase family serine protease
MSKFRVTAALAAGVTIAAGLAAGAIQASASPAVDQSTGSLVPVGARNVCHPGHGLASCLAQVAVNRSGNVIQSGEPLASAFTPHMLEQAYDVTGLESGGRTVAIVDAYGYPSLESDLGVFRSTYKLGSCTTGNGCLTIEGQDGGAPPSGGNTDWDLEQALDVDIVSSICPDCKILMVEASSDLGQAENTAAATPGVVAISNSYIEGNQANQSAYHHPGIAITAGTGDDGYTGGEYPASDTYVTAVGGTSLFSAQNKRGFTETAWGGAGSGCGVNPVGKWQKKVKTTCQTKANSDVSAAADPNNGGLNVYDTYGYGGFIQVGGTSEATPLIASIYALSGDTKGNAVSIPYKNTKHLYDITAGSNGGCGSPLCQAGKGWDGPTGLGTPDGVRAF